MSWQGDLIKAGMYSDGRDVDFYNGTVRIRGRTQTIGTTSVRAFLKDNDGNVLMCAGTDVPTNDKSGYAKGCLFIKTDNADGTKALYENQGTNALCDFNMISSPIMDEVKSIAAELDQFLLTENITDISTAGSLWVVSPYDGTIEAIHTVIDGAIISVDAGITFEIGGTVVTDGGITISHSDSAAGVVDSSTPSALNTVTAGQAIEIVMDGASTNTVRALVTIVMQRS